MRRLIGLLATPILLMALTTPALAISYGEIDENEDYKNTGALIGQYPDGKWVVCTGTLISPTVFLTAAHCVNDEQRVWVSFDSAIIEPVTPAENTIYPGTAQAHPNFACCGANDTFDIAVVVLDAPINHITPADLPTLNLLGTMTAKQLKTTQFVAAGYGTVREEKQKAGQSLFWDPQRRFAEQTVNSLTRAWVTFSMNLATGNGGTCYGDSGGPHFLGDTVVALTVTGDVWCKATDKSYRLDTPVARDFLDEFVTLP